MMPRKSITLSLDVEASGPIPGPWWMCSLAVCRTDDVLQGWSAELRPLEIPSFTLPDDPSALEIVAKGLKNVAWDPERPPEENVMVVRRHFERQGRDPEEALIDLRTWISEQAGENRPVIIGSPITFDFMWLYWYWWYFLEEMPLFGFSGLDVRSYFMGSHGVDFLGTGKERYLKHYPNRFAHTHDPLDDARQQGQIWQDMVNARLARKAGE